MLHPSAGVPSASPPFWFCLRRRYLVRLDALRYLIEYTTYRPDRFLTTLRDVKPQATSPGPRNMVHTLTLTGGSEILVEPKRNEIPDPPSAAVVTRAPRERD